MRTSLRIATAVAGVVALAGCTAYGGDAKYLTGPSVTETETPYDNALACLATHMNGRDLHRVAVGQIADRTGKVNYDEGTGNFITQGAGDILSTELYEARVAQLVERLDTRILEWELQQANDKYLGDGESRTVRTADGRDVRVQYRAVPAGGVRGSDYYVVGSINSLDFAVESGGVSARIAGIGPRARFYRMVAALDLRLVNTRTGVVETASSVNKQIIGEDMGFGIGRFFGQTLVEVDAGTKRNEPLHLALRAMLQRSAFEMMSDLYGIDAPDCRAPMENVEGVINSNAAPTEAKAEDGDTNTPANDEDIEVREEGYNPAPVMGDEAHVARGWQPAR